MGREFLKKMGLNAVLVVLAVLVSGSAFAANYVRHNPDGSQTLMGHVPLELRNKTAFFRYHAANAINAQIILPIQNQTQLTSFLQGVYDPKSPNFHHFLTPAEFAQSYGASAVDTALVKAFLSKQGITVTGQSANGTVLNVSGSIAAFEKSFGTTVNYYQKSDGTLFYAPTTDPTIPASLAGKILAIGGLDNAAKFHPHAQPRVGLALPKAIGTAPGGFLAPNDIKTAYNLTAIPSNGAGQNVALFELDGYQAKDITAYETQFGVPAVPLQNILVAGFNGVPNYGVTGGAAEVTLDIELVSAFAPGASSILVYQAPNTTLGWILEWMKIASDNKAKVISCSWGEAEQDSPTMIFDNIIFQQMAAQGQSVFAAAGDSGAYAAGPGILSVVEPASQPYATAVGISNLTFATNEAYGSEVASTYGGGGVSSQWSIPAYQVTLAGQATAKSLVSTTMRNLPDVVLTADMATLYSFYINGSWSAWFGSSIATPIWASFIATVNQGLGNKGPIGSVNTALYQIAQGSNSVNDFHSITSGDNGHYPALLGYNDATGLGSLNGLNLYNDLLKNVLAVTVPAVPTGVIAVPANKQVSLSWAPSLGAVSYNVKRSLTSNGPYTTIGKGLLDVTYTDNRVINGTSYYYVVSAVNTAGESVNSVQVSAVPVLPKPLAPTALTVLPGNAEIILNWNLVANATSYTISRSLVSGGPYITLASSVRKSTYTDTTVTNGTTYYYVVNGINASGQGPNSLEVNALPSANIAVLPPTSLTGSVATYLREFAVFLQWQKSASPQVIQYKVYRSTGTSPLAYYGSVDARYSGAYDLNVGFSTAYNYAVTAVTANKVESPASNQITVVTPAQPIRKR